MDPKPREHFRRLLLEKRDRLVWQRERMREGDLGQSAGEAISELSTYDNHPADVGTETWLRSQELAMRARSGEDLVDVQRALERLREGTYGYCTRCGEPIEAARLAALPETPFCRPCRERLDRAERADPQPRPVEEEVLAAPLRRSLSDGRDDVEFDGEDAWRAVARYGSSDTPSDVPGSRYPDIVVGTGGRRGAIMDVESSVDAAGDLLDDGGAR